MPWSAHPAAGWVISYMSIGVGWIVGTAMMKASMEPAAAVTRLPRLY